MIEPAAGGAVLLAVVALAELVVGVGQFHNGQAGGGLPSGGGNIGLGGKRGDDPAVGFKAFTRPVIADVMKLAANTNVRAAAGLV